MHTHEYWKIESDFRHVAYRPEYGQALDDAVTALILCQIVFWSKPSKDGKTKMRVIRHGQLWIAKPRQEMLNETGVTLRQYHRAMNKLQSLGLIQMEIGRFQGKTYPHIRLQVDALKKLMETWIAKKIEKSVVSATQLLPCGATGKSDQVQKTPITCYNMAQAIGP